MKTESFAEVRVIVLAVSAGFVLCARAAEPVTVLVDCKAPRVEVSPTLYGVFFEEINHAGEGGLYAEMVMNRDFEITSLPKGASWAGNLLRTKADWQERKWFGNELWGWNLLAEGGAKGTVKLVDDAPLNAANPHSMRITVRDASGRVGVVNAGFWGMNVKKGKWYDLSFFARTADGSPLEISAALESACGRECYGRATVSSVAGDWRQYRCSIQAGESDASARLSLTVMRVGTVQLDVVSLFPRDTFKGRPNGLRPDLAQALADLKPAFVRFPGGAIVGGMNLDNRVQWKRSVGPIEQRCGTANLWGYWTSNGLGFHDYLQLCEDIGAAALWVCNPGFSDNYRHAEYATPEQVGEFVLEALDAIEYALGPTNSTWGAQRAANGHPAPFPLRYVEIGNEASTAVYRTNYLSFYQAIHSRYPALTIISNQRLKEAPVEMVDDHKYGDAASFFAAFDKYDKADRRGPKVYVGEFGCNRGVGQGNVMAALSEAAYLLGLERNSDVVRMASYAPLFFHVNDVAWPVNMIGFDSSRVAPRSSYYVQQMLAQNRPDEILQTKAEPAVAAKEAEVFAVAGLELKTGDVLVRVVNRSVQARKIRIKLQGVEAVRPMARVIALWSADPERENTVDEPDAVLPACSEFSGAGPDFTYQVQPCSFTILRLSARFTGGGELTALAADR
jgi:alpha-L-arabinofuranosidase